MTCSPRGHTDLIIEKKNKKTKTSVMNFELKMVGNLLYTAVAAQDTQCSLNPLFNYKGAASEFILKLIDQFLNCVVYCKSVNNVNLDVQVTSQHQCGGTEIREIRY